MSVTSTTSTVTHLSNGTSVFSFSYKIYATTDIVVTVTNITTSVATVLTLNTDYTVALTSAAPSAGAITLIGSYVALATGYTIKIDRTLPVTQLVNLADNEATPADTYEEVFDRHTMVDQQLQRNITALGSLVGPAGPQGPQGPAGPSGPGTGDVLGPAVSPDLGVPQWNGVNSKTLKAGLVVGTAANNLVQLTAAAKLPAVDGSLLTSLPAGTGDVSGPAANTDSFVPQWNGLNSKTLKDGLGVGVTASCLVQLDASAKLPAVDGSQLTNLPSATTGKQLFTSDGNFTAPAGITKVYLSGCGGGGGGGASAGQGSATAGGGGGAGGRFVIKYPYTVVPSSVYAVVIGTGGAGGTGVLNSAGNDGSAGVATTFDGFVSLAGGLAGKGGTATTAGALGGSEFNGSNIGISSPGEAGKTANPGANGGATPWGAGGVGGTNGAGNTPAVYGGGGGGARLSQGGGGGTGAAGGDGAKGILIVEY